VLIVWLSFDRKCFAQVAAGKAFPNEIKIEKIIIAPTKEQLILNGEMLYPYKLDSTNAFPDNSCSFASTGRDKKIERTLILFYTVGTGAKKIGGFHASNFNSGTTSNFKKLPTDLLGRIGWRGA
jgi:hypothetical protein